MPHLPVAQQLVQLCLDLQARGQHETPLDFVYVMIEERPPFCGAAQLELGILEIQHEGVANLLAHLGLPGAAHSFREKGMVRGVNGKIEAAQVALFDKDPRVGQLGGLFLVVEGTDVLRVTNLG